MTLCARAHTQASKLPAAAASAAVRSYVHLRLRGEGAPRVGCAGGVARRGSAAGGAAGRARALLRPALHDRADHCVETGRGLRLRALSCIPPAAATPAATALFATCVSTGATGSSPSRVWIARISFVTSACQGETREQFALVARARHVSAGVPPSASPAWSCPHRAEVLLPLLPIPAACLAARQGRQGVSAFLNTA